MPIGYPIFLLLELTIAVNARYLKDQMKSDPWNKLYFARDVGLIFIMT
jgi:hypothetical protein